MLAAVLMAGAAAEAGEAPERIASINLCTDQLLIALAPRERIVAVGPYAGDAGMSFLADTARSLRQTGGSAEEILKLRPDLVLAGTFTDRQTRERLAAFGIRVETFPPARTLADTRAHIRRVAGLLGNAEGGEALVARIDAALAAPPPQGIEGLTALQFQRRAFASGTETLVGDLMRHFGVRNAAEALGIRSVERTSLEAVLKARPDILILDRARIEPRDQGAALLEHPVLRELYPPRRRLVLPLDEIVCGGPSTAAAIATMRRGLARIGAARQLPSW